MPSDGTANAGAGSLVERNVSPVSGKIARDFNRWLKMQVKRFEILIDG